MTVIRQLGGKPAKSGSSPDEESQLLLAADSQVFSCESLAAPILSLPPFACVPFVDKLPAWLRLFARALAALSMLTYVAFVSLLAAVLANGFRQLCVRFASFLLPSAMLRLYTLALFKLNHVPFVSRQAAARLGKHRSRGPSLSGGSCVH